MANELQHKTIGTELTQSEFEDGTLHQFDSQAVGDTLYASSSTQLRRLPIIYKAANETVNNSDTLQDDDDLTFPIGISETWRFRFFLNHLSGTTPDIKYAITVPSGATLRAAVIGINTSAALELQEILATATSVALQGTGVTDGTHNQYTIIEGYVINSTTAGSVTLQWAQNTADSSDTDVTAGSYVEYHRLA